jgi:hypothetical protein
MTKCTVTITPAVSKSPLEPKQTSKLWNSAHKMQMPRLFINTLARLQARLPAKDQMWLVFSLAIFLTHVWGYIRLFYQLPGLLLKATPAEIAQVASYNLFFFLLDSILITGMLVLVSLVLAEYKLRDHFAISGSLTLIISAFCAMGMHVSIPFIVTGVQVIWGNFLGYHGKEVLSLLLLSTGLGLWLLATVKFTPFLRRKIRFSGLLLGFVERTTVLSTVFLGLDGIATFVIIIGNLGW